MIGSRNCELMRLEIGDDIKIAYFSLATALLVIDWQKIVHIMYITLYLIFFDSKQKFNERSIFSPAVPCYPFEPSGPWSNPPISKDVHARLCPCAESTSPVPKSNIHPKSLHITTMWQRVFINIATVFNNLHHNTRHAFYAFTIKSH